MKIRRVLALFLVYLFATEAYSTPADIVILNGKVATVDSTFSIQQAIAITKNKIVAVGSNETIKGLIANKTKVIDAKNKLVIPGLIDAHCHPFNLGDKDEEDSFSVAGSKTYSEIVEKVAAKVKTLKSGEWIIGSGWSEQDWPDKKLPVHDALSAVTPNNPVFIYRRGGNSAFANAKAMEIAGINKDTPEPYGGQIHRKSNGKPTGFVVNMGNNLIKKHFPKNRKPNAYYQAILKSAAKKSNAVGLTGWHDAGIYPDDIEIYKQLVDKGELNVRSNIMLQNPREGDLFEHFKKNRVVNYGGQNMLQVRSVKVYFDGALGSRGAALYKPYQDDPHNIGVTEIPPEHLYDVAIAGLKSGMQIAPHAIGTRGNGWLLDEFEKAMKTVPVKDPRFRSEHAQIILPKDAKRFKALGVIPSMQLIHATSDMSFAEDRLGPKRVKGAYAWRTFREAGLPIAAGSDFTVESHDPLKGFYAGVTRQNKDGLPKNGWLPKQKLTREETLKAYTIWAAYAAFQENIVGSIEKGKLADIVILDKDILTIPVKEILNTKVTYTIVNGNIVYER